MNGQSGFGYWLRGLGWILAGLALASFMAADAKQEPPASAEPAANDAVQPASRVDAAAKHEAEPSDDDPPETPASIPGRLIRVPLPITGSGDTRVQRAIQRALAELPKPGKVRPVLILEIAPAQGQFGEGSTFGRALELAQFISSRELGGVKTVAYLPKSIRGHGVLVAMACEEIVMAPDAQIGDAGVDESADEPINSTVRDGYRRIAANRRTIPPAVAVGMLDKQLEVLQVETEVAREFVLREELEALRKKSAVQNELVLKRPGELGRFTGGEARELGFAKYLAPDRAALARAMGLAPSAIEDDPSLEGEWRAVRVPVQGALSPHLATRVQRLIEDQIRDHDVNFICLWIDSPGGSLTDSMSLANFLAGLDGSKVRTVAYIPEQARGVAALVAAACDEVVMHRDAVLGGGGAERLAPEDIEIARKTIRESLAKRKARSWSLPVAFVDPDLKVFRASSKENARVDYFCEEELEEQPADEQWALGAEVKGVGDTLKVRGDEAEDLGLARHVVGNFEELKRQYGLEENLELVEPGWAGYLIDALAAPGVAMLLLLIGFAALYAELQSPGIGIGAFIAGVCFLLFFWSKYLDGTAAWLEVLLFAAGVACVLLELFVLPGAGIFALGGGSMIIISLVLASQTFVLPHNDYEFGQLRDSLLGLIGVGFGVGIAAMLMRRYLPHAPMFSHMMLQPPSEEERERISHREALVEFDHLLGKRGQTTTPLSPSGKALFGNELVDVITDGEFIGRGQDVFVAEVHGNRILVKSVGGAGGR